MTARTVQFPGRHQALRLEEVVGDGDEPPHRMEQPEGGLEQKECEPGGDPDGPPEQLERHDEDGLQHQPHLERGFGLGPVDSSLVAAEPERGRDLLGEDLSCLFC